VHDDRRDWLILFCLALVVRLLTAWLLTGPPYMDAYYYTVGAWRLAEGDGFTEPFLWHYLDNPTGIPRPGFLYWMPLPSILAALSVRVGALFSPLLGRSFLVAQLPFVVLSALLPLISYSVAWQATGLRRHAWTAGLLTLFSGFFFPYWTLPETFTPFAVFGSLALWLAGRGMQEAGGRMQEAGGRMQDAGCRRQAVGLLVGLLVGLAHLTRADGILLLPVVALAPLLSPRSRTAHHRNPIIRKKPGFIVRWSLIILGYLLVMGPWFLRNLSVIGAPLSPAGIKTLWLTTYDDFFCYGCDLSPGSYLAWGWGNILHSKLFALWTNFQRLMAEDCMVFLLPFVFTGLYRLRRRLPFTLSITCLFLLYLAHSLAFTFPGWRGGFFHSSAALLPFLHAAAVDGLDAAVRWAAQRRRWNLRQAQAVFSTAAVIAAVILSVHAAVGELPSWRDADAVYREAGAWLDARGAPDSTRVVVGNPPGFWYHTRMPAVVVPNGDVEDLLKVTDRYHVEYVLLDRNRPAPLAALYAGEESCARLVVVKTWGEEEKRAVLYAVK